MKALCAIGRIASLLLFIIMGQTALLHAAPVTINETKFHVTILKEGKAEILYQLTFTEHETRDRIRTIGQFIEPMKFIESYGTHRGKRFGVTMEPIGNGFYSAVFDRTTKTGEQYTANMRYLVERPLIDKTEHNGVMYGKFWWAPVQWSLPIGKQTVQVVLPIEIPARINKAELVTPEVMNPTGILQNDDSMNMHQRWIYYPTPWRGKNYLSLHAERTTLSANEKQTIDIYIPARYLDIGAQGGKYTLEAMKAEDLSSRGVYEIEEVDTRIALEFSPGELREVSETTVIGMKIIERGERNIFRAFLTHDPRQLYAGWEENLKGSINGKAIAAKTRLHSNKDGDTVPGAYDLIIEQKTEPGDSILVSMAFKRKTELELQARLYDGRFRGAYRWPGFDLTTTPRRAVVLVSAQVHDKITATSAVDAGTLPITVSDETRRLFPDWKAALKQGKAGYYYYSGDKKVNYPYLYLSSVAEKVDEKIIPPLSLTVAVDPSNINASDWLKVKTVVNDLIHLSPSALDMEFLVSLIGTLVVYLIIAYFLNFIFIGMEIAILGLPAYLIGKVAGVDLFNKLFFPKGRKKFSLTGGYIFSLNCVIVPLRLVYYILSGILFLFMKAASVHPAIKRRFFEKKPTYIAPEIQIETFKTSETVENLNPVETAVFLNRPSKEINLLVMELFKEGYIDIINRNPLQVKILKPDVLKDVVGESCKILSLYKVTFDTSNIVKTLPEGTAGCLVIDKPIGGMKERPEDPIDLLSDSGSIFAANGYELRNGVHLVVGRLENGDMNPSDTLTVAFEGEHPATGLKPYEVLFLSSIAADGTLPKQRVPLVLKSISRSLQGKIWKADISQTAKAYTEKIGRHWDDFEKAGDYTRQRRYFDTHHPWIILSDNFDHDSTPFMEKALADTVKAESTAYFEKISGTAESYAGAVQDFSEGIVEKV
ncbi:MAG: hypothetical protein E4G96_03815, partial [Chrysiogenales bacterium]